MKLQDRKVETPPVLGHGQMQMVFMDILPLKGQQFGLPEPGYVRNQGFAGLCAGQFQSTEPCRHQHQSRARNVPAR